MEDANSSVCMERRCLCAGALAALSMAALGCGGGGGGSSPAPAPAPTATPTPPIATTETKASMLAMANGTAQHYGATSACGAGTTQGILLVRDANGIFAMSASCLHLGGQVQTSGSGFACPCHGSTYDGNGTVIGGPAPVGAILQHYLVRESTPGGALEVDTTSQVANTVRLT